MSEVDMLRGVAALMKDQHGPEHERHEMWAAMAGEPVHKATERPGSIQSVCGLDLADFFCVLDRNNLAEQWANVTCPDCRRMRQT